MKPIPTRLTTRLLRGTDGARSKNRLVLSICALWSAVALGGETLGQATTRASVDSSGLQANSFSNHGSISADGRYVAFASFATNLDPGDINGFTDVFVRDRLLGQTSRVSLGFSAMPVNGASDYPSISGDGRYVAFVSAATNLVPGDTNGVQDVFVRDRQLNLTSRVSVDSLGAQGNGESSQPSLSTDGRYVAFQSVATNLVSNDANLAGDVFVHERATAQTSCVSLGSSGIPGNNWSNEPSISADGRYVAFESFASNLVPGDTNVLYDVFVRDRLLAETYRVSLDSSGAQGNGMSELPSISANGRYVALFSAATNLVPGDTNAFVDVFIHDRQTNQTSLVSVDSAGLQANNTSLGFGTSISADGRFVTFESSATNLVPGDTNGMWDVLVRDRQLGQTSRASLSTAGAQGNLNSYFVSISADGRYVAFESLAPTLVTPDTNGSWDVLVRDRDATGFTSFCDPGAGGVIACPCANPPSGPGRGCDNSSATGGAVLSAAGIAYLSMDSLVFTTTSEKPTATSIVLQGNAAAAGGLVFGQGVRCVAGTLKRLYVKTAVAGSITVPDFGAGDPTVSARAAALGDTIAPGTRWYAVYYRDSTVLGGCPTASTFNITQSGAVSWWP